MKVTDFMTWKAAQDPTVSTYTRKAKTVTDNNMARQFLSKTDEVWVGRRKRLATMIEGKGGVGPARDEMGNKFILSSDASRHSEAIARHIYF